MRRREAEESVGRRGRLALGFPFVKRSPRVREDGWVRESRLGTWFLSTDIWVQYVLAVAVADLQRLLGPRSGRYRAILDVGCGCGKALPLLDAKFKPDVLVGVDLDPTAIQRASVEAARCRCRVELMVGRATMLEASTASFDMIFCHQTVHHVTDPESAIQEFHRVLKPGGVLLLSESCRPFTCSWPVRLLFRHPLGTQKSAEEYLALLRAGGFLFTSDDVSLPYPWWSRPDLGLLEWLRLPLQLRRRETLLNVVAFRSSVGPPGPRTQGPRRSP
jgi:SAM-dependent methyltransferase